MTLSLPEQAAALVASRKPHFKPKVGIVLGSGLGSLAEHITDATAISYQELPGFPISTVAGHAGRLVLGWLEGVPVACLQGRVHYYEGANDNEIKVLVRTLKCLGCEIYLATNATGSLRLNIEPGSLVAISDHINLQGRNPLIGPNDEAFGPRFFPMDDVYDVALRQQLHMAAKQLNFPLLEGIYLSVLGPMFETPAEIRAFQHLGADVVGMSTVPEVIVARHCGLRVAVISAVTNLAAGLSHESITHEGTLHFASLVADKMLALVKTFVRDLP